MATKETGYLKANQLMTLVGTSMKAATSTGLMYRRLHREAIRAGKSIDIAPPGGAYRSNADLHDIQAQWLGKAHKKDWHLNPGSGAMPSLYSVHGLGRCLDFIGDLAWVKQVAGDWGLTFPLVHLGDLNHGEHNGKTRGGADLEAYELKRLARYLQQKQGFASPTITSGKRSSEYLRALRQQVARDHRSGGPRINHENYYLDLEARARAS